MVIPILQMRKTECGGGGRVIWLGLDLLSRGPRSATSAFPGQETGSQSCWALASLASHCVSHKSAGLPLAWAAGATGERL